MGTNVRLAVVMDPIEHIKFAKDTTLAMLLVAAAGLAATLALELGAFAPGDAQIAPRPRAIVAAAPAEVAPDHTREWIAAILARPVFSPDRRPPAEIASTPGVRLPEGLPRLSGVLLGPFGRSAIFAVDGREVDHRHARIVIFVRQRLDLEEVDQGAHRCVPRLTSVKQLARPPSMA